MHPQKRTQICSCENRQDLQLSVLFTPGKVQTGGTEAQKEREGENAVGEAETTFSIS